MLPSSRLSFATSEASSRHTLCPANPCYSSELMTWAGYFPPRSTRRAGSLPSVWTLSRRFPFIHISAGCGRVVSGHRAHLSRPNLPLSMLTHALSHSGETVGTPSGVLAEIASCQLEYTYLALLTGNKVYWENVRCLFRSPRLLT